MSEEQQNPIDPSLPAHVEAHIQSRSLGLIQMEFGVLQTNYFQVQARLEGLMAQRVSDLEMIEGLKRRAFNAEDNIRILQEQLLEEKNLRQKAEEKLNRSKKKTNTSS